MVLREALTKEPVELKFGTSGLRGLVQDMTDLECYINVKGFLDYLREIGDIKAESTIYIAGDLRASTHKIMSATAKAITDSGYKYVNEGLIPTPALALFAFNKSSASIMVTGSHIPSDRNGIKFYKAASELLKQDEVPVVEAVTGARKREYEKDIEKSQFDKSGQFKTLPKLKRAKAEARNLYLKRYMEIFPGDLFKGKQIVVYQHSAVGRDLMSELFELLGAKVISVGRSDSFVPIDTENITTEDQEYFNKLSKEYPKAFAIVSTDGDSDRPFLIDDRGNFHRGDIVGAIVAKELKADHVSYPVSANDLIDEYLDIPTVRTKIGSPYVISSMQEALDADFNNVVAWEVNGGFMTGSEIRYNDNIITALPTRDALLPILIVLQKAIIESKKISEIFANLPKRYAQAGILDNFPKEASEKIIGLFGGNRKQTTNLIQKLFTVKGGFPAHTTVDLTDGARIIFENNDIVHIRPSGNAPQIRVYANSSTQGRADRIVKLAIKETDGILRNLEQLVQD